MLKNLLFNKKLIKETSSDEHEPILLNLFKTCSTLRSRRRVNFSQISGFSNEKRSSTKALTQLANHVSNYQILDQTEPLYNSL